MTRYKIFCYVCGKNIIGNVNRLGASLICNECWDEYPNTEESIVEHIRLNPLTQYQWQELADLYTSLYGEGMFKR